MIALLVCVLMMLGVFGCAQPAVSTDAGASAADSTQPDGGQTTGLAGKKVGITFSDLSNPVWAELVKEAERYGKEMGLEITYVDAQSDTGKQVTQIENFIQNGMDAIVICAVESNAVADVTKKAMDEGIYVVGYTQTLENCNSQYLVDPYNTGYACGKRAAEWINENYKDAEVVEWGLMDLPTFPEIIDRANGIKDGIAENAPNAKLVATAPALTAEEGLSNAENFLQANPEMKVIACIGGGGSVGGNEGMKTATTDFASVGLFGIDATEQEIQNILNGDPQKSSISLGGGKAHAHALVDMAAALLNGETVEKDQFMPVEVIDSKNAQAYWDEIYAK